MRNEEKGITGSDVGLFVLIFTVIYLWIFLNR